MKKFTLSALLCSVVLVGLMSGCSMLGGEGTGFSPSQQETKYYEIKDTYIEDEYYVLTHTDKKTLYINKTIYVQNGGSLGLFGTESDPYVVKFGPNGKIVVKESGLLDGNYAIFTSYKDTEYGEAIKDAPKTAPAPNDWYGINVYGGSSFTNCTFKYAGKSNSNALRIYENNKNIGKSKIENCRFKNNGGKDTIVGGTAALQFETPYDRNNNYFKDCFFENNIYGLCVPFNRGVYDRESFFMNNKYDGIYVTAGTVKSEVSYLNLYNNEYWFMDSAMYTIDDGGTVNFLQDATEKLSSGYYLYTTVVNFGTTSSEYCNMNIKKGGTLFVRKDTTFKMGLTNGASWKGIRMYKGSANKSEYLVTNEANHIYIEDAVTYNSCTETVIQETNYNNY